MPSPQGGSTPLGVKLAAAWSVITGIALLVLGVAQTPLYLPLGVALLVGAYGLWMLRLWGLILVGLAFTIEGVQDIVEGALVELLVVLAVLTYLYTQRHHFSRPNRSVDSG